MVVVIDRRSGEISHRRLAIFRRTRGQRLVMVFSSLRKVLQYRNHMDPGEGGARDNSGEFAICISRLSLPSARDRALYK